ncbi:hypothetical protein H8959_013305, partial [Pygathrix nigripes]
SASPRHVLSCSWFRPSEGAASEAHHPGRAGPGAAERSLPRVRRLESPRQERSRDSRAPGAPVGSSASGFPSPLQLKPQRRAQPRDLCGTRSGLGSHCHCRNGQQNLTGAGAHPPFPAAHQLLLPSGSERPAHSAFGPSAQPVWFQRVARCAPAPVDAGLPGHALATLFFLQSAGHGVQLGGRALPAARLSLVPSCHSTQAGDHRWRQRSSAQDQAAL